MRNVRFSHVGGLRKGETDPIPHLAPNDEVFIGRDPSSIARVDPKEAGVSRRHVRMGRTSDGLVWVEDAGSANGTYVNGKAIRSRHVLRPGSTLRLGPTLELRLEWAPADEGSGDQRAASVLPVRKSTAFNILLALVAAGSLALVVAATVLVWSIRRAEAEADAALQRSIARVMSEKSGSSVGEAVDQVRARAQDAPSLPSGDPLMAHIEVVVHDMSTGESRVVLRVFRDLVARKLAPMLKRRSETGEPIYCRAKRIRPDLVSALEEQLETYGGHVERATWISYIPWIETGYRQDLLGDAGEVGMWQFMKGTARDMGLRTEPADQRCDLDEATRAAARLFVRNTEECGPRFPLLAVAAYNTGAHNACKVAHNTNIPEDERDFLGFIKFDLLKYGRTREYIPEWLAATFIGEHPAEALAIARGYDPSIPDYAPCPNVTESPLGGRCKLPPGE